jgi:DNA-directed RNA polymerase subunit RPC12/RpoP
MSARIALPKAARNATHTHLKRRIEMFCPKCGKEIDNTAKVCGYCGFKIPPREETPPAPKKAAEPALPVMEKPAAKKAEKTPQATPAERPAGKVKGKKTPGWVWGVVGGVILVILVITWVVLSQNQKRQQVIWVPQFSTSQAFTAGFWSQGEHKYAFKGQQKTSACILSDFESDPIQFTVSDSTQIISGKVYLRVYGISQSSLEGDVLYGINPQQATIPIITFRQEDEGLFTHAGAETQLESCSLYFRWDDEPWQLLDNGKVIKYLP